MSTKKQDNRKRQRSESPVPTPTSNEHADISEEPAGEYKNKRVRFDTAASPTHTHLSLGSDWSMDLPTNFKSRGAFILDLREKLERAASPTHSYVSLRTDWSMDLPTNFKGREALNTRMGLDRASSPTLSSVSEWTECFVEQPTNSKTEATFHLNPRLLTENHLKCPICKSMLKDPVSISCGHNYCRDCINTFWDSCAEEYICPECGRGSKTRPELNTNTALAEVVKNLQQAGFSPALPPSSYAGPEDVACDFCSERRLKAVKSCSTCDVFLCETHIKDHYTIPALQKHTLCDVTGAMEKKLSQKFLPTDNSFSEIVTENQNHTDKAQNSKKKELVGSFFESMLNAAKPKTKPKAKVNKDNTNVQNLKLMYLTLQQEVLGLKKSFSSFSEKYYDEDKQDDGEEDASDTSDSDEREEDDSDGDHDDNEEESKDIYDDEKDSSDDYDKDVNEKSYKEDSGDEEDSYGDYDKDVNEKSYEEDSGDEEDISDEYDKDTSEVSYEEDSSERSYDKRSYEDSEDSDYDY